MFSAGDLTSTEAPIHMVVWNNAIFLQLGRNIFLSADLRFLFNKHMLIDG